MAWRPLDRLLADSAAAPSLQPHRVHHRVHSQQTTLCGGSAECDPVNHTLAVVPSSLPISSWLNALPSAEGHRAAATSDAIQRSAEVGTDSDWADHAAPRICQYATAPSARAASAIQSAVTTRPTWALYPPTARASRRKLITLVAAAASVTPCSAGRNAAAMHRPPSTPKSTARWRSSSSRFGSTTAIP